MVDKISLHVCFQQVHFRLYTVWESFILFLYHKSVSLSLEAYMQIRTIGTISQTLWWFFLLCCCYGGMFHGFGLFEFGINFWNRESI
jgi:hypothetical protein